MLTKTFVTTVVDIEIEWIDSQGRCLFENSAERQRAGTLIKGCGYNESYKFTNVSRTHHNIYNRDLVYTSIMVTYI